MKLPDIFTENTPSLNYLGLNHETLCDLPQITPIFSVLKETSDGLLAIDDQFYDLTTPLPIPQLFVDQRIGIVPTMALDEL